MRVHGVTGSTDVSTVAIDTMEVGELLMGATMLPIVPDVFGGADGVLGNEALGDKRIYIDFRRDRIEIMRSRSERPGVGMSKIPLKLTRGKLLAFKTRIGSVATTAVIDTGAQRTIGNQALRTALNRRSAQLGPGRNHRRHARRGDKATTFRRRRSPSAKRRSAACA